MQLDVLLAGFLAALLLHVAWRRWFAPAVPAGRALVLTLLAALPLLPVLAGDTVYGPLDTNRPHLPWATHEERATRAQASQLHDVTLQFVPWQTEARRQLLAGQAPLLNPYAALGQPLLANGQAAPLSLSSLASLPFPPTRAQGLRAFLRTLLALWGTWAVCTWLGCRPTSATLGAIAYAYGGSLSVWKLFPHAEGMALWPFLYLATEATLADGDRRFVGLLGLSTAGTLLAGHPESAAVALLLVAVRAAVELVRRGRAAQGPLARLATGSGLGALATACFTLPLLENILHSQKLLGGSWQAGGASLRGAVGGAAHLLLPGIYGWPARLVAPAPLHWLAEGTAGTIPLLLAAASGWRGFAGDVRRRFLATVACTGLALHLGAPLLADRLGVRLVLAPRYAAYAAGFAVAVLAALALERWTAGGGRRGGAVAVAAVALTGVHLLVAFGTYVPAVPARLAYPRVPLLDHLGAVPGPFRLVGTRGVLAANSSTVYALHDIRSHDPTESARYVAWLVELLGFDLSRYHKSFAPRREHEPYLRLLAVRFLLAPRALQVPAPWQRRGTFRETALWELPGEVEWARFPVQRVEVRGAAAARRVLARVDPLRVAVLETAAAAGDGAPVANGSVANGRATVRRVRTGNRHTTVEVAVAAESWLVLAQAAVPGWRARADGRPIPTAIADGILLAARVPAGTRVVELDYSPLSWRLGLALSALAVLATAALAFGRARRGRVRRRA